MEWQAYFCGTVTGRICFKYRPRTVMTSNSVNTQAAAATVVLFQPIVASSILLSHSGISGRLSPDFPERYDRLPTVRVPSAKSQLDCQDRILFHRTFAPNSIVPFNAAALTKSGDVPCAARCGIPSLLHTIRMDPVTMFANA